MLQCNTEALKHWNAFRELVQMDRIHGWGSCGREFESHIPEFVHTQSSHIKVLVLLQYTFAKFTVMFEIKHL